jgi:medium-chain acyl-[acyl-carrier-protein] hydrolase
MNAPHRPGFRGPLVHGLPEDDLVAHLDRLGGMPREIVEDKELRAIFLPLLRADLRVAEEYVHRPAPPLSCPISVWGGADDFLTNEDGLEAWSEITRAEFRLRILPGRHQFIASARSMLLRDLVDDLMKTGLLPAGPVDRSVLSPPDPGA